MRLWANNAKSTLASSASDVAATLTLETGDGGKFPSPAGDEFFDVTITQGGNLETSYEICRCTGRSGDVLTVERGLYGTSVASWDAGSKVEIRIHAAAMGDFATSTEEIFTITDGASVDIDPANGGIQLWTLGDNRTPTATNFANGQSVTLLIDDGAAYAITWTIVGKWFGGAPTLSTDELTGVVLFKAGNVVYGAALSEIAA